jgi:hypothetical protein
LLNNMPTRIASIVRASSAGLRPDIEVFMRAELFHCIFEGVGNRSFKEVTAMHASLLWSMIHTLLSALRIDTVIQPDSVGLWL